MTTPLPTNFAPAVTIAAEVNSAKKGDKRKPN